MTDRPILFSGPMIRALLEGRKTQTRRVLNKARVFATPETRAFTLSGGDMARALQNADRFRHLGGDGWFWEADAFERQAPATRTGWMAHIGYAPGDRLWVREAHHRTNDSPSSHLVGYDFADGPVPREFMHHIEGVGDVQFFRHSLGGWGGRTSKNYPSIHMPRWASRLTLIVTDVRVQRLQEISYSDAVSEGLLRGEPLPEVPDSYGTIWSSGVGDVSDSFSWTRDPTEAFRHLWDSLNAKRGYGWDANPWVVALTFNVIKQNIDQIEKEAA